MEIRICMGSSCYSRGNSTNLQIVQDYLKENRLDAKVVVRGELCHGKCKQGPNLMIDGVEYTQVDPNSCIDLLNRHVAKVGDA